jgi:hypothetical protein
MKTNFIKQHLWLIILLVGTGMNAWAEELDSSKKKEINQSFEVSTIDQLNIENSYGNVTVTHWAKNEVAIKVVVTANAASDSKAQEVLDRVTVELSKSDKTVRGVTTIKNRSGWFGDNGKLTIDYFINMPSKLAANISQKYGNINLPEKSEGKYNLEVKYGKINAGAFTEALNIDADYSDITLKDVQNLAMDIAYCGNVKIGNGKNLSIDSKYSNVTMQNVDKISLDGKYGNLTAESVDVIVLELKYGDINIKRVKSELSIAGFDYSNIKVSQLDADFKKVNAEGRYGNLSLSIPSSAAFRVNAEQMKYGNVDLKGFKITNTNVENKVNYYYQINGGGNSLIQFKGNNYSNLKINAL